MQSHKTSLTTGKPSSIAELQCKFECNLVRKYRVSVINCSCNLSLYFFLLVFFFPKFCIINGLKSRICLPSHDYLFSTGKSNIPREKKNPKPTKTSKNYNIV